MEDKMAAAALDPVFPKYLKDGRLAFVFPTYLEDGRPAFAILSIKNSFNNRNPVPFYAFSIIPIDNINAEIFIGPTPNNSDDTTEPIKMAAAAPTPVFPDYIVDGRPVFVFPTYLEDGRPAFVVLSRQNSFNNRNLVPFYALSITPVDNINAETSTGPAPNNSDGTTEAMEVGSA